MTKFRLLAAFVCIVSVSSAVTGQELVRVRISDMVGPEPGTLSSISHPSLFDLDPSIASAELTFSNPAAPSKNDTGPATWLPALTPFSVSNPNPAGRIDLTIVPVGGEMVSYGSATYTTRALFARNPSSLRLQSSDDGFAATLSVINLDIERTETVALSTTPSDTPFVLRWEAHDDFGANGGGAAGFATGDVVVLAPGEPGIPTLSFLGGVVFAALLAAAALIFVGRV